jgi:hypothetical protein
MIIKEIEKSVHLAESLKDKVAISVLYAQVVTGGKDKVYDAINLEKQLILDSSYLVSNYVLSDCDSGRILHVISEGYLSGGHTRLCERLAAMGETPSDLLVTRHVDDVVMHRLEKYFSEIFITYCHDVEKNVFNQLKVLARYSKVILHIHPDDILLVISLGLLKLIKKNIQVYFVNHADHLFSYGKSLPDVMFQISNRGYQVDSTIRNSSYNNSFLGIPISNTSEPNFKRKANRFLMAGSSYKMKPNSDFSAPQLVKYILNKNHNSTFTVIGAGKSDYWWWFLKLKFKSRFLIYGELGYNDYINVVKNSDVCIDTLPITGGTAFVEMYMLGLNPIGLNTGVSGYTPLDIIKVNSVSEVMYEELVLSSHDLYSEIQNVHSIKAVENRYTDALNGCFHNIPISLKVSQNNMDLFVRSKKQDLSGVTLKHLLSIQSLTNYQKLTLFITHFKGYQLFTRIPLKFFLLLYKKTNLYFFTNTRT